MFNINYFKNKYIDSIDSKLENAGGGLKVSINGELKDIEQMDLTTILGSWIDVRTLPCEFYYGSAVVYNNEIHRLGGYNTYKYHYKYNTSTNTWYNVSTIPYNFSHSSAIVLDNEIHILGSGYYSNGSYPYSKYHYKYNTSNNTWSSVSTLPYNFGYGSAIVLNNEIHILGSNYNSSTKTSHYKYNTSTNTWSSVSTLPYEFYSGSAIVLDNEIHILGSNYNSSTKTSHYSISSSISISKLIEKTTS